MIITGCGRSGTAYTAEVLKYLGLDVGHERLGKDGIISWPLAVMPLKESVWGPNIMKVLKNYGEETPILHQVRDPIKTISSCRYIKGVSWRYIEKYIPSNGCKLKKAMQYWYYWNKAAEDVSEFTYRVENLKNELPRIFEAYKMEFFYKDIDIIRKTINKNRKDNMALTLKDMLSIDAELTFKIVRMAKRYGYAYE